MWRPGKLRFLIGVKNPFLSADRDRQKTRPLAGPHRSPDSQLRSGYALPSSRIRRHFLIPIDALFSSCLPRSMVVPLAGLGSLCGTFGDLSGYPLDAPVPDDAIGELEIRSISA